MFLHFQHTFHEDCPLHGEYSRWLGNYKALNWLFFETDVVLINLEAGQIPKLTAKWDKGSLSHSQGSLLWQESRWLLVEITNLIRERERESEDAENSRLQLILLHRLPFSCCHKNVLIKTERSFFFSFLINLDQSSSCIWSYKDTCTAQAKTHSASLYVYGCVNDWVNSHGYSMLCINTYKGLSDDADSHWKVTKNLTLSI